MKKKTIAVNILYTHTKTHKESYPRQQMPTKQATDSSVVISLHPHTLTHTQNLFHANVKRVKTNPLGRKTIENTKQTGYETVHSDSFCRMFARE